MNWFQKLFTEGSAFARVAAHEAKVLEANGAIIALKAAEKVSNVALDELEAAAAEVHKGRDAIQSRIESLGKSLGV